MKYELKTGGTIEISLDKYLSMSDDAFEKYIMYQRGSQINDPFHGSALELDPSLMWEGDYETNFGIIPDIEIDPKEFMPED